MIFFQIYHVFYLSSLPMYYISYARFVLPGKLSIYYASIRAHSHVVIKLFWSKQYFAPFLHLTLWQFFLCSIICWRKVIRTNSVIPKCTSQDFRVYKRALLRSNQMIQVCFHASNYVVPFTKYNEAAHLLM